MHDISLIRGRLNAACNRLSDRHLMAVFYLPKDSKSFLPVDSENRRGPVATFQFFKELSAFVAEFICIIYKVNSASSANFKKIGIYISHKRIATATAVAILAITNYFL